MKLDDHGHNYGKYHHVVVFFNATNATVTDAEKLLAGLRLHLHPVQEESSDPTVRKSTFDPKLGVATIPALTTAVFVSDRE